MQKLKTVTLFFILFLTTTLLGSTTYYPFLTYSTFNNSFKTKDMGVGIYGDFTSQKQNYKVGLEYKESSYEEGKFDNFQLDTTLGYERFFSNNILFDAALHITLSDLYQADLNQVYYLGIGYIKKQRLSFGLDNYYSIYNNYSLAKSVIQFSPYCSYFYPLSHGKYGKISFKLNYNFISSSKTNVPIDSSYHSGELALSYFKRAYEINFSYFFGKSINLVKDKAFSVYNNNEIHKNSYNLSFAYMLKPAKTIRFSYLYKCFDEYDPLLGSRKNSAKLNRFVLSANFKF